MSHPDVMDKLVSLCKRRGFIFQSSEIYGGTGSVWDYGPLGVELKKNLKWMLSFGSPMRIRRRSIARLPELSQADLESGPSF